MGIAPGIEVNLAFRVNLTMRYVPGLISATTGLQYSQPWKNIFFQGWLQDTWQVILEKQPDSILSCYRSKYNRHQFSIIGK